MRVIIIIFIFYCFSFSEFSAVVFVFNEKRSVLYVEVLYVGCIQFTV